MSSRCHTHTSGAPSTKTARDVSTWMGSALPCALDFGVRRAYLRVRRSPLAFFWGGTGLPPVSAPVRVKTRGGGSLRRLNPSPGSHSLKPRPVQPAAPRRPPLGPRHGPPCCREDPPAPGQDCASLPGPCSAGRSGCCGLVSVGTGTHGDACCGGGRSPIAATSRGSVSRLRVRIWMGTKSIAWAPLPGSRWAASPDLEAGVAASFWGRTESAVLREGPSAAGQRGAWPVSRETVRLLRS